MKHANLHRVQQHTISKFPLSDMACCPTVEVVDFARGYTTTCAKTSGATNTLVNPTPKLSPVHPHSPLQ